MFEKFEGFERFEGFYSFATLGVFARNKKPQ